MSFDLSLICGSLWNFGSDFGECFLTNVVVFMKIVKENFTYWTETEESFVRKLSNINFFSQNMQVLSLKSHWIFLLSLKMSTVFPQKPRVLLSG